MHDGEPENIDGNTSGVANQPFGRLTLSGSHGRFRPLSEPPFYGYPSATVVTGTYAGLKIDQRMAVLNVHGEPIKGLFAAGEVAGGFHGESYLPGTALVMALCFGSLAAESALDRATAGVPPTA